MIRLGCALAVVAGTASAGPAFQDMSSALPRHVYTGGWEHFVGGGVALFDCNADTLPEAFIAGGEAPASLMRNLGDFAFERAEVPQITGVVGAYPLDLDNDGFMDLFVLRVGPNVVLQGGPDCTFRDVTQDWGIPQNDRWSTAFAAWWEPDATRPSMAIGNYVDRRDPDGPFEACDDNVILRPTAAGYAEEPLTPGFCPLSMLAARDARGGFSLRISNDRHYYVKGGFEQLWDIPQQRYLGVQDSWPQVSLWGMGIASRDLNGDGRDEVMLTSMGDQLLQMARGDGGYDAVPFDFGTYAHRPHTGGDGRPSTGWHAEFGDVDNDARADLFIAKGNVDQMPGMATKDPNNLLMQQRDGRFQEAGLGAGIATLQRSRGAGLADFDGDGLLDLIVVNRRAPVELYRNVTPKVGQWLRIDLWQEGANVRAIGAQISVQTDTSLQVLQKTVGGGHAGGQSLPLHVGLGAADRARVTVTWPDGTQSVTSLGAGATYTLSK